MSFSLLLAAACALPTSALDFVAFPAEGSMALRGEVPVSISLGDDPTGLPPEVTVTVGETSWTTTCALAIDGVRATCDALPELAAGEEAVIEIRRGDGLTRVHHVTSALPARSEAWELTGDLDVTTFGADDAANGVLELLLAHTGIVAVVADDQLLLGPASSVDGAVKVEAPGLTLALPLQRSDNGLVETEPVDGFLPLSVDGAAVHAYLDGVSLVGLSDDEGLLYALSGAFPMTTIDELVESMGTLGALVRPSIVPDIDTDGDGVVDAVSFAVEGMAVRTVLKGWTEDVALEDGE